MFQRRTITPAVVQFFSIPKGKGSCGRYCTESIWRASDLKHCLFFPPRYFLLLSISYSQLSYFFCQSYAHQKVESSRKKGQRRKPQRETQCSDNSSESNEIMMAVFTSDDHHEHLSSWHLLMSVFSLCCLGQEILQTHFQLSLLCLELDP